MWYFYQEFPKETSVPTRCIAETFFFTPGLISVTVDNLLSVTNKTADSELFDWQPFKNDNSLDSYGDELATAKSERSWRRSILI